MLKGISGVLAECARRHVAKAFALRELQLEADEMISSEGALSEVELFVEHAVRLCGS